MEKGDVLISFLPFRLTCPLKEPTQPGTKFCVLRLTFQEYSGLPCQLSSNEGLWGSCQKGCYSEMLSFIEETRASAHQGGGGGGRGVLRLCLGSTKQRLGNWPIVNNIHWRVQLLFQNGIKICYTGTSLVVQWLRSHLPEVRSGS